MLKIIFKGAQGVVLLLALSSVAQASSIIEISIPVNSQNTQSRPSFDNVFDALAVGGVLNLNLGIGIIVNPVWVSANDAHDFALHQNAAGLLAPSYLAPNVPDPLFSTVVFRFDAPTIVKGVEIVQHVNGVTKVAGALGDSLGNLQSVGSVFGPSGDAMGVNAMPPDGTIQMFDFGNTNISGTVFTLTIAKTSFFDAYALHRAFLLDQDGNRILPANEPYSQAPEPSSFSLLVIAGVVVVVFKQRSNVCG